MNSKIKAPLQHRHLFPDLIVDLGLIYFGDLGNETG